MSDISIITTEDGSHSLFNSTLNETYHSTHGAIQESKHVFIEAGLANWLLHNKKAYLTILEIGFGTGLNAFLTALYPLRPYVKVYYNSWEAFPINEDVSSQLNYSNLLGSPELFKALHKVRWENYVDITPSFALYKQKSNLVNDSLRDSAEFDIIYYDAFGPSKQPEMWTKEVLSKVVETLKVNGIFVTYCAKGQVKRDLKSLGLEVETLPGPPGKLQMIRAVKRFQADNSN